MRNMSQRGWALRPLVEQSRKTEKKRCYGHRMGVNMLQFCSVSNSLSHSKTFSNPFEPFQIKWEVYFSEELCRSSLLCRCCDSACICICVCIVVHGYTTISLQHNWFLWCCFVLQLKEIQFLSWCFLLTAMSRSFRLENHQFIAWKFRTLVFLTISAF